MQRVARSGLFSAYLRTSDAALLAQALAFANAETRTVQLLGLSRELKDVTPSLDEYLGQRATEDASGATNGGAQRSDVVVEGEVAASEETSS